MTRKRITARQLNRILRKLGRHVQEDITGGYLNYGGCAVYAALVGRELQRLGVPVGVVVNGYGGANLDEVRLKVTDVGDKGQWNDNGVYFNHVGLEYAINGHAYHCDSEYLSRARHHPQLNRLYPGRLAVDEAEALADDPIGWNRCFDRRLIPEIKEAVEEAFAPLTEDARELA